RRGVGPAPAGEGSRREWRTRGGEAASQSEFERMTPPPRASAPHPGASRIIRRLARPRQRGRASGEVWLRGGACRVRDQLVDELLRVRRQKSPRIPGDTDPPADRRPALNEWQDADTAGRNPDVGRNDRAPLARARPRQ